jgi:hypothetical protein
MFIKINKHAFVGQSKCVQTDTFSNTKIGKLEIQTQQSNTLAFNFIIIIIILTQIKNISSKIWQNKK